MTDREKAIRILEGNYKDFVLRHNGELLTVNKLIALLKEQEPVKVRHLHGTKVSMHEEIVFTDECGNCSGYLLKPWKACPICGKAVKWE